MCCLGSSSPAAPVVPGPVAPVIIACLLNSSEVLVIDELGLPMANQAVTLTLADGSVHNGSTGADGKLCLSLPPGTPVTVEIANTHEARAGDSTTTPSGQHFLANGTGP